MAQPVAVTVRRSDGHGPDAKSAAPRMLSAWAPMQSVITCSKYSRSDDDDGMPLSAVAAATANATSGRDSVSQRPRRTASAASGSGAQPSMPRAAAHVRRNARVNPGSRMARAVVRQAVGGAGPSRPWASRAAHSSLAASTSSGGFGSLTGEESRRASRPHRTMQPGQQLGDHASAAPQVMRARFNCPIQGNDSLVVRTMHNG